MFDISASTQMVLVFFILISIRIPVAFALGLSALYAMWIMDFGLDLVGDLIASGVVKFSLLAIPFFILAGVLMGTVGIAERLIRFFRILIGKLPGGMGVVGTIVCLFWGAVSGSGPASVAAIGPLIIKGMEEDGYPPRFAAGLVCAGAALSIVIPPSIGLVLYGVITETSIGKLFIAAILPGLVLGILMICALPFARFFGHPNTAFENLDALLPPINKDLPYLQQLLTAFREAFWGLMMPIVILGGIYSGIFTATEAAIVATVYALLVGLIIYRTLNIEKIYKTLVTAASSSAVVMFVVAYASLFGWVITVDDLIGRSAALLLGLSTNEAVILLVIMIILIIAGMFMDGVTIMYITLPVFIPVARELQWDLVWFGVLVTTNLAIGLFTPPVGINLYVAANITRTRLEDVAFGAIPFVITCLIGLAIIAAIPELSSVLINKMK